MAFENVCVCSSERIFMILKNCPSLRLKKLFRVLFVLILLCSFFIDFPSQIAAAGVSSCDVSVSPSTTTRDTTLDYTFNVGGVSASGGSVSWVKITRPSADFTITNGSSSGWSASVSSTDVVFTGGALATSFSVSAAAGSSDASSANWTVEMSINSGGANAKTCTGSLGTSISGSSGVTPSPTPLPTAVPDTTAPSISNVKISGVSESSVTITWDTSESANAVVNYGSSTGYGSSVHDSNYKTSHSITIGDLSKNTSYHGQLQSADSLGNTATSNDFIFATSQEVTTTTITTTTVTTVEVTPTPTPTPLLDTTPPKVSIVTDLKKVFLSSPAIDGKVSDNDAVSSVEYTFDDGKNWSKIDLGDANGKKSATFTFTPLLPGEGNYSIRLRATDGNDNQASTKPQDLIIDRLPPAVGGSFLSIGPQILQPDSEGNFISVLGLSPKLTLSAIGGPTSIDLHVNDVVQPMAQNVQSRLWSVQLHFIAVGTYMLQTHSLDGAGNQTDKVLGSITVLPNGTISNAAGPVDGARLAVYYFDANYRQFRLWNGVQYGQENPQLTDREGQYKLFLPPGTYYLHISGPFGQSLQTDIFTTTQNTPIIQNFQLKQATNVSFHLLTFPFSSLGQNNVMMNLHGFEENKRATSALIGQPFPDFSLGGVQSTSLTGKPMIVSVLTHWLPQTANQMSIFGELAEPETKQVLVVMSQESNASALVFSKQGGYGVPVIADPDGVLVEPLKLTSLPTHFFLDRKGVIMKVVSGVLDKEEIETFLTGT